MHRLTVRGGAMACLADVVFFGDVVPVDRVEDTYRRVEGSDGILVVVSQVMWGPILLGAVCLKSLNLAVEICLPLILTDWLVYYLRVSAGELPDGVQRLPLHPCGTKTGDTHRRAQPRAHPHGEREHPPHKSRVQGRRCADGRGRSDSQIGQ